MKHNLQGNCWDNSVAYPDKLDGEMNDICDKHDEPRGECSVCPECPACKEDI